MGTPRVGLDDGAVPVAVPQVAAGGPDDVWDGARQWCHGPGTGRGRRPQVRHAARPGSPRRPRSPRRSRLGGRTVPKDGQQVVTAHGESDHGWRLFNQGKLPLQHIRGGGPVPGKDLRPQPLAARSFPAHSGKSPSQLRYSKARRPLARTTRVVIDRHRVTKRNLDTRDIPIINAAQQARRRFRSHSTYPVIAWRQRTRGPWRPPGPG